MATAAELRAARDAGAEAGRDGKRSLDCPYPADSLEAHVWIRWCVRERLAAAGLPRPGGSTDRFGWHGDDLD